MNKEQLLKELELEEISCSNEQADLLITFMNDTLEANEKFNLTAIKDKDAFVEKMIFDSSLAVKDLDLSNKSIIDVGTGAGYPGLVIKILCPSAQVTLLDSTSKKINHIKELSSKYNLSTDCVSARAEDYAKNNIEKFDYATARAVASLNILLELIIPMLKVGGTFIVLKGAGYEEEINSASKAFKTLSCHIDSIYECDLPVSKEKRAIIRIVKDKPTNKKYPREYNQIKRQPL